MTETKEQDIYDEHCPKSKDGRGHCVCWWEGDGCCWCGVRALTKEELEITYNGGDPRENTNVAKQEKV